MVTTNSASFSYLSTASSRMSGLASGMDIDSIVEKLMKAESAKMEKLQQQKQKYEWQRDSYRGINTKLESFRTDVFDNYLSKSMNTKTATVSDASKISVKAGTSAVGNLSISSATLATSAVKVSDVNLADSTKAASSDALSELGLTTDGAVTVNVIQKDGTLKPTQIDYKATDTIDDLVKNINKSGAGLTAIFSDGKMSLTANATGNKNGVSMEVVTNEDGSSSELFKALGFTSASTGVIGVQQGINAKYTVNGIEKESTSNTFTDFGYTITLNSTIGTSPVTISSATDTDGIVDKVKSIIELYNGLIEGLNSPIKEKVKYDYKPLTDAQKSTMSEDEIKKWEVEAKKGLLRNDTAISSVVSNMRSTIYGVTTTADSKYNALFNIGITTSKEYTNGGKLEIDEAKLRQAIEANPEAVTDLFNRQVGTNGADDKGGLLVQLRSIAKTGIDSIAAKAGKEGAVEDTFTLGKTIKSVNDRITTWKDKLKVIEARYFKQFSAMETAMQKANSQSSLFAQG